MSIRSKRMKTPYRLLPALLFPAFVWAAACSSSSSDVGTATDAGAKSQPDSSKPKTTDDDDDASSADCTEPADCVQTGTSQVAKCWACTNKKCVAVAADSDPNGACESGACTVSTCNGLGACSPSKARGDGTECGIVCSTGPYAGGGSGNGAWPGICKGSTCIANHGDGGVTASLKCPLTYCDGPNESCGKCPATGCTAKCSEPDNFHCP